MHYLSKKEEAIKMRKSGMSLGDIVKNLGISKSTVSLWCKDMFLSESAIKRIKTQGKVKSVQGLLRYSELKRKERIERNIDRKSVV